jgi:hypothetical protein
MAEVRSGSFRTTGYEDSLSPDHYVFSWTLASQSIVDNTSTINWSVVAAGGSTAGYYNTVTQKYVTVYGATKSNATPQTTYNGTTPFSGTTIIKHDANGKGSFSASCGGAFEYSGAYNSTGSGSWDLPTIQRATKPTYSALTANLGDRITITLDPANNTFKHKIRYFFGNLKNQIAGLSIDADFTQDSTITFDIPTSLGEQIPNALSGVCQVYCYTYTSTGVHIGTEITNITVKIPNYWPKISNITLIGNGLLNDAFFVKGKSNVEVNAQLETSYGAGIKSVSTVIDGVTYSGLPFTSNVLSAGKKTATITLIDTRDVSITVESGEIEVYDYFSPNITEFTLARQADGTTVIATVKGNIADINNKNAKTVKVTLNGKTNTITPNSYTINATTTFTGVSTDETFTAKAVLTDSYVSVEREANLPTIAVTMDFLHDGTGIAMGKVAERSRTLDVAWDIKNNSIPTLLGGFGDVIPSGSNLNTDAFLVPGNYLCALNASVVSLTNCPTQNAFKMCVYNCLDTYKEPLTGDWMYMVREITDLNGTSWIQFARKMGGNWDFGNWRLILDSDNCPDYIFEQGVWEGWNYIKWKSGKIEIFGDKTLNFPEGTKQDDYLYRSIVSLDLYNWFSKIIMGNCPVQINGMVPQLCRHSTNLSTAEIVIVTSRAIPAFTITAPLYIVGIGR